MLIIRGTKKLRDRLKQAPAALPTDESTTAHGDWFATALFWKPQAALLVNAHDERLEWTGGPIDPDAFDPAEFTEAEPTYAQDHVASRDHRRGVPAHRR